MSTTVIIHTERAELLTKCLAFIESKYEKSQISLRLNCKNYIPWNIESIKSSILCFGQYIAMPTTLDPVTSTLQMLNSCKTENILIIDELTERFYAQDDFINGGLLLNKVDLLRLNLDSKYETVGWFISDLYSQMKEGLSVNTDNTKDSLRYFNKLSSPFFRKRIIYVDGGLGDHVMALPLLQKLSRSIFICCKYRFVFEHLDPLGFIDWNDDLFGGYKRYVYEHGSTNNSKSIIDAFFEMYGHDRQPEDILNYTGPRVINPEFEAIEKIALICTSAAKINGQDSNKDWSDIKWFKLIDRLKKGGYYVIQVGSTSDNQIPNVDSKFLDKKIENLSSLIEKARLWISVDTFFHHFASAINPEIGICLTPFYNDHAKHKGVTYIEKDCGKDFSDRKWWLDLQQPERKECMSLISVDDVVSTVSNIEYNSSSINSRKKGAFVEFVIPTLNRVDELRNILSSLICQKDQDWSAHVVIDDVYNNSIIELISSFNTDKIYYSNLDKNYNDYGHTPRNYGKNKSQADYIVMTGDDNYYVPSFVTELKKAALSRPVLVYWDMVHNHQHYQTKLDYQYWKSLLVYAGIDIGAVAIRRDVAQKYDLCSDFCADGNFVEKIVSEFCDNFEEYKYISTTSFTEPVLDNIVKIDKVLYVHN